MTIAASSVVHDLTNRLYTLLNKETSVARKFASDSSNTNAVEFKDFWRALCRSVNQLDGLSASTLEALAKNAAAHIGKKPTPETCAKIGNATRGPKNHNWHKPRSAETNAKQSASRKGKAAGPEHWNWMGGVSREPYGWEWNNELKEEVRRRDGYRCQLCGAPQAECGEALCVHHVNYKKEDNDPVNLVALCRGCHGRTATRRKYWMGVFMAMATTRAIARPGQ